MPKVTISQDDRGRYQRDLGWRQNGEKWVQHRFKLGKERAEALVRSKQLEAVWDAVVACWTRDRKTPRPSWDAVSLAIGRAVAEGKTVCPLNPSDFFSDEETVTNDEWRISWASELHDGTALLEWLQKVQADFPMVRVQAGVPFEELAEAGIKKAKGEAAVWQMMKERAEARLATGIITLHKAFDAFGEHLKQKYRTAGGERPTPYCETLLDQLRDLKEDARDLPLPAFGLPQIEDVITHWRNRPVTKRGKPCSIKYASHCIKLFRAFLKWLNKTPSFPWRKPVDYEVEPVRIRPTHAEVSRKAGGQVQTWTQVELALLWQYALPIERLYFLLALNCGFGIAEISGLQMTEVSLDEGRIKRVRYKSQVYGEWSLWPETVAAIRWFQSQRPKSAAGELIVNREGKPLWTPTVSNNPNRTITNAWERVVARIRKDQPEFRYLSFNKLRKTAADGVRKIAGGEIASIFLSHGQAVRDDLLEIYANRDFSKVFKAVDDWGNQLRPIFFTVPDPYPTERKQPKITLGKMRQIKEMRAGGYKVTFIAKKLGVSTETVRRHSKPAEKTPEA